MTLEEINQVREVYSALGVSYQVQAETNGNYVLHILNIPHLPVDEKKSLSIQLLKLQIQELELRIKDAKESKEDRWIKLNYEEKK